jgi:energy-coupling factor transporter ATP-binding protein EcfA2
MKLERIEARRYGILMDCDLDQLSDGITVYWGPNGCGKSTLVDLLRGVCFGFAGFERRFARSSVCRGSVTFRVGDRSIAWDRTRDIDRPDHLRTRDADSGRTMSIPQTLFPEWVTREVFDEILTVGYDEADQFQLLTKMCLAWNSGAPEAELQRIRRAEDLCLTERVGEAGHPGVELRIECVQQKRAVCRRELQSLGKAAPDLPHRIQKTRAGIASCRERISQIDLRLAEIEQEIAACHQSLAALRRRNVVPAQRAEIQQRIEALNQRMQRWNRIRDAIAEETEVTSNGAVARFRGQESLESIRALVRRLEDRVTALSTAGIAPSRGIDRDREIAVTDQLRSEVAALCVYLQRHRVAVDDQDRSIEDMLTAASLQGAEQMQQVLSHQIECLRSELHRADNVLQDGNRSGEQTRCGHDIHRNETPETFLAAEAESAAGLHDRITELQRERTQLVASRGEAEERLHSQNAKLTRLLQESKQSPSLEQLDTIRGAIAECDAELHQLEIRLQQLRQAESDLQATRDRLQVTQTSRLFEIASGYIRRLTEGSCLSISPDKDRAELVVQSADYSQPQTIAQLSRGTRHQVALALRLALVRVHSESGQRVPLVLDDVFITSDDERAAEAVQLMTELADEGQQIVFFTCQNDVRALFRRYDADVRIFGQPQVEEPPAPTAVPRVVEQPRQPEPEPKSLPEPAAAIPVISPPAPVQATGRTNWLYYLEVDHTIDALDGLQPIERQALEQARVVTVLDLLDCSTSELDSRIRNGGFLLARERIQAIRNQAELACRVPMLQPADAALLVAVGCDTTEQLAGLRAEVLFETVTTFQKSDSGRAYRRHGRLIDQQQAINWSRSAQYSRSWDDARSSQSRFSVRSNGRMRRVRRDERNQQITAARRGTRDNRVSQSRRRAVPNRDQTQRRAIRNARQRRMARRFSYRQGQSGHSSPRSGDTGNQQHETALRFHLSRNSPVEDAPSIGPKTAERLLAIGVQKVSDLLNQPAARISERLASRRLTPDVIELWQAQARLMCQVPELRGHDVQILVACGINSPEELLQYGSDELMELVAPFCESREGVRVIRGGNPPDLEEVTNWLSWARRSRSLRAA